MKTFFYLLLMFLCIETKADDLNTKLSGFITSTVFSDESVYPNKANMALNIDIEDSDNFAFRTQLGIPYDNPIRRIVVEKTFMPKPGTELTVQLGRFPRLDSFYNPITDAVGTSGLAMLPLGQYNRRMLDSRSFTSMDGIRTLFKTQYADSEVNYHINVGDAIAEDECKIHAELFNDDCRLGYSYKTDNVNNYDIGLTARFGNWRTILNANSYRHRTVLRDPENLSAQYITSEMARIRLDMIKLGLKYDAPKWWVQSELLSMRVRFAREEEDFNTFLVFNSYYVLAGAKWTNEFSSYVSYSAGVTEDGAYYNNDNVIGSTYIKDNLTYSIEYHKGQGLFWKRYFELNDKRESFVISITKRF